MNNGGNNRPSLLSGGEQNKANATGSGRILADMEGRSGTSAPRAKRVPRPTVPAGRRWLWIALIGLLAAIAAILVWRSNRTVDNDGYGPESVEATHGSGPSPLAPTEGGAIIVDAPLIIRGDEADSAAASLDAPSVSDQPGTDGADAPSTTAAAAASIGTSQAPRSATARSERRPANSSPVRTAPQGKDDLLGTLMGIIKEEDKPKVNLDSTRKQPQTMDELIEQIQADDRQREAQDKSALDQIGNKKRVASTESSVQVKLRRCPAANSAAGVECRRLICAPLAGKDPACPAR